ncbi:TAT-variant-translocated molybdopterin oxidoreductase [Flavisolibacter sp. BT320]|nr:TAT-variant-translocated molybdopterin oxidoreductase [Flavisolibacter longurius]
MSDKKYWQSFAEFKHIDQLQKLNKDEFKEELPFADLDDKVLGAKTARRDFLKYVGFSTAAATIAASCEVPVRKAMPYVNRPENLTPGVAKYYASTYVQDGEVVPVVVKVREGRPIKIEGNTLYPYTQGGTSARAQASVLDLYDTYRVPHPKRKTGNAFQEVPTFDQVDQQIGAALAGLGGAPVVLLTGTIVSPSTKQVIAGFLSRFPGSRHVQYDAVSFSGMLAAHGGRIPAHNFDRADLVVSLGADFLTTWLAPVEFARQYSSKRKLKNPEDGMSKHYQFESHLSPTGASADERFTHRPSETGAVALALLAAMGGGGAAPALPAPLTAAINKVAADLRANNGRSLVVCGSNDPNVQTVVREINRLAGAFGTTLDNGTSILTRQGDDAAMATLVEDMNAGRIGALLIYDANPAYDYFDAKRFTDGLAKVRLSVSFNEKMDETSELCQWIIPTHHYLESWGDAEPRTGYFSFIQPTIFPLFKTRPYQTSLLKWSGNSQDYEMFFRTYWAGRLGGDTAFDTALQDGVLGNARVQAAPAAPVQGPSATADTTRRTTPPVTATPAPATTTPTVAATGSLGAAITALSAQRSGAKDEVVLFQQVNMLSGKQAGNPWLLELPDPITRTTYENYAMISTKKAEELGIDYKGMDYEYYQEKPVITLAVGGKNVSLPAMVVPGMNANTIAVPVGYGRSAAFSKAAEGLGQNVFPFVRWDANTRTRSFYNEVAVTLADVDQHKIARIQMHNSYEGRTEVVKETTLATFKANPNAFSDFRKKLTDTYAKKTGDYRKEGTLYGDHVQPGPKWGMSIDLNACYGCGACVVACHLENNVPVVGKNEVLRHHEMHWLRIDRYFVTDEQNPDNLKAVVFQPMLCQHCDNAPCENVCPVAATFHNSEGLNQMAYPRCIGTRYCANNCPYKVRRFNWGDYTGASTHGRLGPNSGVGKLDPIVHQYNDELTRMVLNPDVTTRSRGVMEKCTFCVQRTQEGKLKAKMENRQLAGDDVTSACAQACPTGAIVFGNANDLNSAVTKTRNDNPRRLFYVLEQIHTLPNVSYLAKIRNTEEVFAESSHNEDPSQRDGGQPVTPQHEPATEAH